MKQLLVAAAVAALLAGCGSNVKVDQPAAADSTASTPAPAAAQPAAAAPSDTTGADLGKDKSAAPTGSNIVYFDFDKYDIKSEYQSVVESQARFLQANKGRKAALEGHADERGSREYNLALGQKRAEAVRRAMGLLGVNDSQLEAVSFGEEKPADPGHNEEAWAKNRRVEVKLK